jgi:hypothetical protein
MRAPWLGEFPGGFLMPRSRPGAALRLCQVLLRLRLFRNYFQKTLENVRGVCYDYIIPTKERVTNAKLGFQFSRCIRREVRT